MSLQTVSALVGAILGAALAMSLSILVQSAMTRMKGIPLSRSIVIVSAIATILISGLVVLYFIIL